MKSHPRSAGSVVTLAPHSFALVCALIVAAGAGISIGVFLLMTTERGSSYGESIRLLSVLHREIAWRSAIIYTSSLFVMVSGVSFISLLYSHRVAGPLHKLGMIARSVATGDLSGLAKLRRRDAVHALADDMNELITAYRLRIAEIEQLNTSMQKMLEHRKSACWPRAARGTIDDIAKTISIMKTILAHVRL